VLLFLALAALAPAASAQRIIINQLNDVNFGTWPGAGDLQATEPHCVGRDTPNLGTARRIRLRVRGSGRGGRMQVISGANRIDFTLEYRDNVNSTAWTRLRPNRNFAFFAPHWIFCQFGYNIQEFRVTFREADMVGKPSGNYVGTVTITVSPQ
jgi:hypothetical protein